MREFTHEDAREVVGRLAEEFGPLGIIVLVQRTDGMHVMGSAAIREDAGNGIRAIRDSLKDFFRERGTLVQMPGEAKEGGDA